MYPVSFIHVVATSSVVKLELYLKVRLIIQDPLLKAKSLIGGNRTFWSGYHIFDTCLRTLL